MSPCSAFLHVSHYGTLLSSAWFCHGTSPFQMLKSPPSFLSPFLPPSLLHLSMLGMLCVKCITHCCILGGYSPWKGVRGCAALKTPFSRSLSSSLRPPHFSTFQFFKAPFSTKITNFTKFVILEINLMQNFRSKASNLAKIQFFKPYFFKILSSLSPIFFKESVL